MAGNRLIDSGITRPFITIIIPTHNRPDSLLRCLESIWELNYPESQFEVIVIDDSSTAFKIVEPFQVSHPIRIADSPRRIGLQRARNLGISMAKGEILCFLDDDVIVQREWLASLVKNYASQEIGGVGGRVASRTFNDIDASASKIGTIDYWGHTHLNFTFPERRSVQFLYGCNMSFRVAVLHAVGGFNELLGDYPYGDDQEIGLRIINSGQKLVYEPTACVVHRMASSGGTRAPPCVTAFWTVRNVTYMRLAEVRGPTRLTSIVRSIFGNFGLALRRGVKQGEGRLELPARVAYAVIRGFVNGVALYLVSKDLPVQLSIQLRRSGPV